MPRPTLKQRKDGRYRCKYKDRYFYGATSQEAYEARDRFIKEGGDERTRPITVSQYAAKWLPVHKASVSDKTYNDYAKQINVLISTIGEKTLKDVTPSDIKRTYNHYIGYSNSTIKRARMLYIDMWESAIEDGYAIRNPCKSDQAKPHKGPSGSHRTLTPEEDRIIIETPASFRLAVLVMRYAGLRRGEVLALNIDRDVDFNEKVIHVRGAVRYDSNQPILSHTKTDAGMRDIPLFDILAEELKGHHGLVAPSAAGTTMSESAFRSAWAKYVNTVEISLNGSHKRWYGRSEGQKTPWIAFTVRPHDLRHSFCTMLRDAGVEMKLAMEWMGHADEKMILHVYDHITERRIQEAINRVNNLGKGVKTGVNSDQNSAND